MYYAMRPDSEQRYYGRLRVILSSISPYHCAPGPEHPAMLQGDTATMGSSLVVLPMIDSEKIMLMIHD